MSFSGQSGAGNVPPESLVALTGVYDHTVYSNEENGWTVGILNVEGRKPTTIVGPFSAVEGETVQVSGRWVHNKKFGEQFEVAKFEGRQPATLSGLKKYLGSGMIKGVGPVYAERLIQKFGLAVADVIENKPQRLREVEGIGQKRQKQILESWSAHREIKNIMLFLQSHGVGTAHAMKIYKNYKADSVSKVTENPYRLANDIAGIGFRTADRIALNMGVPQNSGHRAEAGLLYVLSQMADKEGHVFSPRETLIGRAVELLDVDTDIVRKALRSLEMDPSSAIVTERDEENGEAEGFIYLKRFQVAESGAVDRLKQLLATPSSSLRKVDWPKFFEWYATANGIQFSERQQSAIKNAYAGKVTVITGGPGTGKSTLIKALTTLFSRLSVPFLMGAPTGRAAKRMTEVTGHEAKTLHRMMEFEPKGWKFKRNVENPLECDCLIVDEVSMIDAILFHHLLKAVPPTARLILVGDSDQLPSVGAGNVLGDLIRSEAIPVIRLTDIYRQQNESQIIVNAHRINRGESPCDGDGADARDFFFVEREDPEGCVNLILTLCEERIPLKFKLDSKRDIQVLVPMNKGIVGITNLNFELQRRLNPNGPFLQKGTRRLGLGDRVIQTRNNYDLEVYNGDIGRVIALDPTQNTLSVDFEGRPVEYESSDLDELDLAYAISIHKSQGSEFPAVVIPLLNQHFVMLARNLLYTAVTRAKRLVVLVGSKKAVEMAVKNVRREERHSRLGLKLKRLC